MKILICTQTVDQRDPVLGFFHRWLVEFAKHCESVLVICLREGQHQLPGNVKVLSLGKETGKSRIKHLRRFIYYIVRNLSIYDAVFVHMNPEYVLMGRWLWKIMRKRTVLWYTHKSTTLKLRLASRMVNVICTASPESFRLKRRNVVVTGHGIDTEIFAAPRAKPVDFMRIVTVGRISKSKGVHTMLEAASLLPRNGVPYRFTIVGGPVTRADERYYDELLQQIDTLHLQEFVGFAGPKDGTEIPAILARSDVFLHASDTGSLDKAMLEAMAARCVVLSSNDSAEVVLNAGHDALFVHHSDAGSFALALQRIYEMGESNRAEIGERLRREVTEHHSLTTLIEKLIWILKENK